jgi:hypothetical protein
MRRQWIDGEEIKFKKGQRYIVKYPTEPEGYYALGPLKILKVYKNKVLAHYDFINHTSTYCKKGNLFQKYTPGPDEKAKGILAKVPIDIRGIYCADDKFTPSDHHPPNRCRWGDGSECNLFDKYLGYDSEYLRPGDPYAGDMGAIHIYYGVLRCSECLAQGN